MIEVVLLYALLTTSTFYLLARAMITRWLWSRYPPALDFYFSCASCSGFAYGVAVGFALGWTYNLTFLGLPGQVWWTPIVVGLCSIVWTPILANFQINALIQLGVVSPIGGAEIEDNQDAS